MNIRKAIGLIGILLLTSMFYFGQSNRGDERSDIKPSPFFDPEARKGLFYVSVISQNGSFVFVKAKNGQWEFKTPYNSWASEERFDKYLDRLFNIVPRDLIPQSEVDGDPKLYGLEVPFAFIRVKSDSYDEVLSVGKQNKVSGRYYGQLQSKSGLYLIEKDVVDFLVKEVSGLRNRQIVDFTLDNLDSVVILTGKYDAVKFAKRHGRWQLNVSGDLIPFNERKFIDELGKLSKLRADAVTDLVGPESSIYGLDNETVVFSTELSASNKWDELHSTIRIGKGSRFEAGEEVAEIDAWYVKPINGTAIYQFRKDVFGVWQYPLESFRTKVVFPYLPEINKMVVFDADSANSREICSKVSDCRSHSEFLKSLELVEYEITTPSSLVALLAVKLESSYGVGPSIALFEDAHGDDEGPNHYLRFDMTGKGNRLLGKVSKTHAERMLSLFSRN